MHKNFLENTKAFIPYLFEEEGEKRKAQERELENAVTKIATTYYPSLFLCQVIFGTFCGIQTIPHFSVNTEAG